eukprot:s592_g3.t1
MRAASEALPATSAGAPEREEEARGVAKALEGAIFHVAGGEGPKRRYLAEVRRLCAALRQGCLADSLKERELAGEETLQASKQFLEVHEQLQCEECGSSGSVRFRRLASSRDGFNKAETWGSSETEDKGERCRAFCPGCLAEWNFEL